VLGLGRDPKSGKKKQQWMSVKGTRKEAERRLAEVLHQLDTGGFVKPTELTVAGFLHQWLRDYVSHGVRPVSAQGYSQWIERHIIPELGKLKLIQLQPLHIQNFYHKLIENGRIDGNGGLSPQSVLHIHRLLHNALSHGVKWGIIGRNVADAVDPPRVRQKQMKSMDAEGVNCLLEASRETIYHPLFHLAVFTGMRRSELLGLRWCDVDLDMATVSVTQVLHHLRNGQIVFLEPKTPRSKRQIDLPPTAVIALREHKQRKEVEYLMSGTPLSPEDLVFTNPEGKPLLPTSVTHAFTKMVRRIDLYGIRFHDLRHTHASLMLRQGVNIKALQERLGHSTITTTLDIYAHVTPGMQKEAALRFDEALQQPRGEKQITSVD